MQRQWKRNQMLPVLTPQAPLAMSLIAYTDCVLWLIMVIFDNNDKRNATTRKKRKHSVDEIPVKTKKQKKPKKLKLAQEMDMQSSLVADLTDMCVHVFSNSAPFIKYVKPILQGYSQFILLVLKHALLAVVRLIDMVILTKGSVKQRVKAFNNAAESVADEIPAVASLLVPTFSTITAMQ